MKKKRGKDRGEKENEGKGTWSNEEEWGEEGKGVAQRGEGGEIGSEGVKERRRGEMWGRGDAGKKEERTGVEKRGGRRWSEERKGRDRE